MHHSRTRVIRSLTLAILGALATHGAALADEVKIRIGYPSGMNGQVPVVLDKAGIADKQPAQYQPKDAVLQLLEAL